MDEPLVSIALCTYNGERFLRRQIDSLLNQTYPNLEIIICDDASGDLTKEIINSYRDDRLVKNFNTINIGYVKNFEHAISICTGKFIALCDQDDLWQPEKIQSMLDSMGNSLLIFSDSALIDENDNYLKRNISDLRKLYNCRVLHGYVWSNCVWGHAILMNRELLDLAMPVPKGAKHDIWFAFTAACMGKIKYLNKVLTFYRQHSSSETITISVPATKRNKKTKYGDYIEKLSWIKCQRDFSANNEKEFFNRLFQLYSDLSLSNRIALADLLLKNRARIFSFTYRSTLSQLNEIRKICRKVPSSDK
ncbi:MAG: glycosyltransferase family 2 protein [Ginsengibacter sp.]